jgi:hypothetical protein
MRSSIFLLLSFLISASSFQTPCRIPSSRLSGSGACRSSSYRQLQLLRAQASQENEDQPSLSVRRALVKAMGLLPLGLALGVAVPTALSQRQSDEKELVSPEFANQIYNDALAKTLAIAVLKLRCPLFPVP